MTKCGILRVDLHGMGRTRQGVQYGSSRLEFMHSASKNDKETIAKRMGAFLRQYKRRAHPGNDPNDRGYDREIEQYIRRLRPEDLDVLLNGEQDERLNLTNEGTSDGL
jgi:hypothetical protein